MVEHHFFLAVTPKATARSRCACRGKFPTVYTDPGYRAWLEEALPALKAADPLIDPAVRKLPVQITVEVIARRPKTTKLAAPRWDNDNAEKGLWDAMTKAGGWWEDDSQIVRNTTTKRWAEPDEPEGYRILVQFLEAHDLRVHLTA